MSRPTCIEIDVAAFDHNLQRAKAYAGNAKLLAMVKANAYGHGVQHLMASFKHADALGVACLEEAVELRELGAKQPIVLMAGCFDHDDLSGAADMSCDIVIHNQRQVDMLAAFGSRRPFNVWLKLNTGMNRLGFPAQEFQRVLTHLQKMPQVNSVRLMTHLACADNAKHPQTAQQLAAFIELTNDVNYEKSIANSAALLAWPQARADWVRPGLMLYGVSPFAKKSADNFGLLPVMTLRSELIAIHDLAPGATVGYGAAWEADHDTRIGVVPIGYGDGYPRQLHNGAPIAVQQTICPLVGRVSMDFITVELVGLEDPKVGDEVVLWGRGLPVETVAAACHDAIAYELLCGVDPAQGRISVKTVGSTSARSATAS